MSDLPEKYPRFTWVADWKDSIKRIVRGLNILYNNLVTAVNSKQDKDEELNIKYVSAGSEPTLSANENALFWQDTSASKYYLILRDAGGTNRKVELT